MISVFCADHLNYSLLGNLHYSLSKLKRKISLNICVLYLSILFPPKIHVTNWTLKILTSNPVSWNFLGIKNQTQILSNDSHSFPKCLFLPILHISGSVRLQVSQNHLVGFSRSMTWPDNLHFFQVPR